MLSKQVKWLASKVPEHNSWVYGAQGLSALALGTPVVGILPHIIEPAGVWLPSSSPMLIEGGLGMLTMGLTSMIISKLAVKHDWKLLTSETRRVIAQNLAIKLGGMNFAEKALFTNIICFGAIGSGKTAAVVYPILDEITKLYNNEDAREKDAKWGGFVLDVKGDFHEAVIYVMNKHGRDVLNDLVVIRPDNDYYILEFQDTKTGENFCVSCMGGTSKQECNKVLETAKGAANVMYTDEIGQKSILFPNGAVEPLSSFLFNDEGKFRKPEVHNALSQLTFDVKGMSVRWLGWREEDGRLVRVSHTDKMKIQYKLDSNGKRIYTEKPNVLKYNGVHSINNGLTYNLVPKNAASTEAAGRIMSVAEVTGNSMGGDNAYWSNASEKHMSMCIELYRQVSGYEYSMLLEYHSLLETLKAPVEIRTDSLKVRAWIESIRKTNAEQCKRLDQLMQPYEGADLDEKTVWKSRLENLKPVCSECSVNEIQMFTTNEAELKKYVKKLQKVMREKALRGASTYEILLLRNLEAYCIGEWGNHDPKTKGNIMSCVTNLFGDVTRNAQLIKTFCQPSQFGFENCLNDGKVYTLVLSAYPNAQKLIGTCMKLDFQQVVLRRTQSAPVNKERFLMFLADEYQFFITTSGGGKTGGDDNFLSVARQSKIFNLICTQAVSSLLAVQEKENKINAFLQCFGSRIFLQNLDEKTNKLAEMTLGQYWREETSYSGADLKISSVVDSKSGSFSRSQKKEHRFDSAYFPQMQPFEAVIFNKEQARSQKWVKCNLQETARFWSGDEKTKAANNYYQAYIENRAHILEIDHLFDTKNNIKEGASASETRHRKTGILCSWRDGLPINKPEATYIPENNPGNEPQQDATPQTGPEEFDGAQAAVPIPEIHQDTLDAYIEDSKIPSDLEVSQASDPFSATDTVVKVQADVTAPAPSSQEELLADGLEKMKGVKQSKNAKSNRVVSNIVEVDNIDADGNATPND